MDIDTIRALAREGNYHVTRDFKKQMLRREFTLDQAKTAIECGAVIEERPDGKPYPKCTLEATLAREVAGGQVPDTFHLALAVGPELVFITGYWPGDRPPRKANRP